MKFSTEGNIVVERSMMASCLVWRRRRNSRVRDNGEKREKSFLLFLFSNYKVLYD